MSFIWVLFAPNVYFYYEVLKLLKIATFFFLLNLAQIDKICRKSQSLNFWSERQHFVETFFVAHQSQKRLKNP